MSRILAEVQHRFSHRKQTPVKKSEKEKEKEIPPWIPKGLCKSGYT